MRRLRRLGSFEGVDGELAGLRVEPDRCGGDPAKVSEARAAGTGLAEIRRRIWETDDFRPDEPPDLGGPAPRPGDPPLPLKW